MEEYKSKLILFPRNAKKPKASDASAEELARATQQRGILLPFKRQQDATVEHRAITAEEKKRSAFQTLRVARSNRRLAGIRKKKAEEAANK